jgi:hypothetical protein
MNVDPFTKDGDGKILGEVTNLDELVDDSEAEEIVADTVLDYFQMQLVPGIISNWVKKLKRGGRLAITAPDLYEIAKASMKRDISEMETNRLLFGNQEKDWQIKKNAFSIGRLEELMAENGLKIISKKFVSYKVVLIGEKV